MRRLRELAVRPLADSELHYVNSWAGAEGWNPGPHDGEVFNKCDPGSLLTVDHHGVPAGALSVACLTPDFSFAGYFVTAPVFRNSFYGWVLFQAGLRRIENRAVGADAIPERLGIYADHGLTPHSKTLTFSGLCPSRSKPWDVGVTSTARIPFAEIAAYDCRAFGVSRHTFMQAWLSLPESLALGFVSKGKLCGFGVIRRCLRGVRIGPLQADSTDIAKSLIDALSTFAPGEEASIDCPDTNDAALNLMTQNGFHLTDWTIRIYRGRPPADIPRLVYGRMSFALG